ncbi:MULTISPECIES: hypothetical protein [unclassified Modestobacter]|uniref:hypothetical protein n=1 Tax=unclassified Modestobacter TaxID=2643866 RepID=UPI0022AB29A7|nr:MULTISPECIES: hypothetical protein [unclassified Modestobacter]MCZ2823410.1 hypothetical protein [Modestobacter sp. VKM Ac-2981]MCZ2851655.1 hypothetical protein [Modestobacter sp. VKM Ac-2982]
MPATQLDLRGLAAVQPPSRRHVASVVDGADAVHVLGPVPALSAVLTRLWKTERLPAVPVSWQPADDPASTGLARSLGVGTGSERELPLVRDDHGGVLLHTGLVTAHGAPRRALARRFGARAYCDETRVADGSITRIDVRPDWTAVDRIGVAVVTLPLRPVRRAHGRALQMASDPAQVSRDGVPFDRQVTKWTWYADDRVRWRLRP